MQDHLKPLMPVIIAAIWAVMIVNFACAEQLKRAPYGPAVLNGHLENPAIQEASGMAASIVNKGVLWVHNDGGIGPYLFAVTGEGKHLGRFQLEPAENIDWEDMGSFQLDGTAYLLIADIGDNHAQRPYCTLYVVVEPSIAGSDRSRTRILHIAWQRRFRYEGGPRDCEAVAVDVATRRVLLLSKRNTPPLLYSLPLLPGTSSEIDLARKITAVSNIPPPTPADLESKYGRYRSQPTAMDLSPTGLTMAVLTYKHAYLYNRLSKESWKTALNRLPM
ncbi:MAG: hypothetical protein ACYSR9_11785, partial [Planctomycetota bacterium]